MKIIRNIFSIAFITMLLIIGCKEKTTLENDSDHTEAIGLTIYHNNQPYFRVKNAIIDTSLAKEFLLPLNQEMDFEVKFIDENNNEIVPDEESKSFSWIIDDTTIARGNLIEKYKFRMKGLKIGTTQIEFRLNHYEHPDFKTPKVPLSVR